MGPAPLEADAGTVIVDGSANPPCKTTFVRTPGSVGEIVLMMWFPLLAITEMKYLAGPLTVIVEVKENSWKALVPEFAVEALEAMRFPEVSYRPTIEFPATVAPLRIPMPVSRVVRSMKISEIHSELADAEVARPIVAMDVTIGAERNLLRPVLATKLPARLVV
jgi:hypothetical protein